MNDPNEDPTIVKQKLVSSYKNNIAEKLMREVQESDEDHYYWCGDGSNEDNNIEIWPTTWWQQFAVLLIREIKERRYESFSSIKFVQVVAIAFLAGFLWWQSDDSHLHDKVSSFSPSSPQFHSGFTPKNVFNAFQIAIRCSYIKNKM